MDTSPIGYMKNTTMFEAKPTCVIHGLARYFFFCFRSKRVDRCVGVEHEEYTRGQSTTCKGVKYESLQRDFWR